MPTAPVWGQLPELVASAAVAAEGDAGDVADRAADAVLRSLTTDELLRMVAGQRAIPSEVLAATQGRYNFVPYPASSVDRLGVPGIRFGDGPRGVVVGESTAFPVPMARGATFDPALEAEVGDAIGAELTAQGANFFGGVCINLLRHPAWGRAQETYGEDPLLLGAMGSALSRSVGQHALTCVKHFACNSMENSRFWVDIRVDDRDLDDIYLPHFRQVVDAGADAVMTAYNKVNGEWCGQHDYLLNQVLRGQWSFDGFVMTDFGLGVHDMADALNHGQDLEMPMRWRSRRLGRDIAAGEVTLDVVARSVGRILRTLMRGGVRTGFGVADRSVICSPEHLDLARRTARRSFVLLRNEVVGDAPSLPLGSPQPGATTPTVAVIGRLAARRNTGDKGSSNVRSPSVVTVLDGLTVGADSHGWSLVDAATDDTETAERAASRADAAVVIVGNDWRDEGEFVAAYGGDRKSLRLSARHEELIMRVARANPRTIVLMVGGSAFECGQWIDTVSAAMTIWYSGAEGGAAVAEVLFGDRSPGGRLPMTWARSADQLPEFSRWSRTARYGPLHGYRLMAARGTDPQFAFGHGLGYGTCSWDDARVISHGVDAAPSVSLTVSNRGSEPVTDVVQVYAEVALGSHPVALPTLVGFASVTVAGGDSTEATIDIDPRLWAKAAGSAAPDRPGGTPTNGEHQPVLSLGRSADPRTHRRLAG